MNNEIDVEAELARILQEEIWKEITAETGETKQDLDNKIIAEIVKLKDSLWWAWQSFDRVKSNEMDSPAM